MKVAMAYGAVVLIWSTTPLAIKWSSGSMSYVSAITLRVMIALGICVAILALLRRPLIQSKQDWYAYAAGLIGVFPNMLVVFWSAQHIPSGLAAVIFGLYPFMVGLFSLVILKENIFNYRRILALLIALIGLAVININQFTLGGNAVFGVLGMISSTLMFGLSSVWVKHIGGSIDPLRQSSGTLVLAAPFLLISWWLLDGQVPQSIDQKTLFSILYLALAGSVIGGFLFFFVLRHCRVSSVGLITFMTPVVALLVGLLVNDEQFTVSTTLGCILIIVSLAIYQDVPKLLIGLTRAQGAGAIVPPQAVDR